MQFISSSEKQTFVLAKKFASRLTGREIIGLIGELGAGKTIFTKGLASGLGIKKNITSPTFVLMKVYPVKTQKHSTIKSLVHLDAYRIKHAEELIAVGIKDYLNRPDTVTVIEWADKIKKILPKKTRFFKFIIKSSKQRKIILRKLT